MIHQKVILNIYSVINRNMRYILLACALGGIFTSSASRNSNNSSVEYNEFIPHYSSLNYTDKLTANENVNYPRTYHFLLKKQKENEPKTTFIITPNPSKDKFNLIIINDSIQDWTIEIYSISGNLVERQTHIMPKKTISIGQSLKSGVYLLRVFGGAEMTIEKIIKS